MAKKRSNTVTIRNGNDENLANFLFADAPESRAVLEAFKKKFNVELSDAGRADRVKMFGYDQSEIKRAKEAFYQLSNEFSRNEAVNDNVIAAVAKQVGVTAEFKGNAQEIVENGRGKRNDNARDKKLRQDRRNHPEKHVQFLIDVEARNDNQAEFMKEMDENDVTFGVGPAGTGKTFLAAYQAIKALQEGEVDKIFLARPAVGNGKDLGALPGDEKAKLAPYLRPLYDELEGLIGKETLGRLQERGVIEIAPVEFMRGRTFKNAFVILDEGQNTSYEQMKMALTRIGEGSKMVVTGDPKQTDLKGQASGLALVVPRLEGVEGVAIRKFEATDIVRSKVVSRIVTALETDDEPLGPAARNAQKNMNTPKNR